MTAVISRTLTNGATVYWYAERQMWIPDADLASWYAYPVAQILAIRNWGDDADVAVESHTRFIPPGHFDA
jgi:hypothetical protein